MSRASLLYAPLLTVMVAFPAQADIFDSPTPTPRPIHSQYGGVGLIKTRTARMAPDSTLATTISWNDQQQRYGLTFQAAPWLETTFGYTGFEIEGRDDTFDRQFDIKIKLWNEGLYLPKLLSACRIFSEPDSLRANMSLPASRLAPWICRSALVGAALDQGGTSPIRSRSFTRHLRHGAT